ncbi:MFS transporter [Corynebacterium bovis]|uniref:MFS transporter n=3 Tax=Corynebacterium bovis TaxID=36808 RepID=UPI003138E78E
MPRRPRDPGPPADASTAVSGTPAPGAPAPGTPARGTVAASTPPAAPGADPDPAAAGPAPAPGTRILPAFIGLAMAMFMFSANQTMLSTALPTIVGELDGGRQLLWISTAYMLAATVSVPVLGKLGDVFGVKRIFMGAVVLFTLTCVAGSVVPTMSALIAARALQGVAGGGLVVLSQALVATLIPPRRRGTYMGAIGGVFVLSTVAGPVLGGLLAESVGWRWCFGVNVPLGVLAFVLCWRYLRLRPPGTDTRPRLDIAGMVLLSVVTTGIVLVTAWGGRTFAWTSPAVWCTALVAVGAVVLLVGVERRAEDPVLPAVILTDRNFIMSTVVGVVLALGAFGVTTYMPTYIQVARGVGASVAGLILLPMMVTMFAFSLLSGAVVSRTQRYRVNLLIAGVVSAVAFVLVGTLGHDGGLVPLMAVLGLLGVGLGFGTQLTVLVVQNSFPVRVVGSATGLNNLFRDLGGTLGMSVVGSLFTARLVSGLAETGTGVEVDSVTPALVRGLPDAARELVAQSYDNALIPVLVLLAPLMVVAVVAALFIDDATVRSGASRPLDGGAGEDGVDPDGT